MTEKERILDFLRQRRDDYRAEQAKQEAIEKRNTREAPDAATGQVAQKVSQVGVVAHNRAREAECAGCAIDYCIQMIEGWK